jgi:2-polyprenyl-6-methoxyphenol hydroxylase-like FAD-dependent oxidoreductase
MKVAVVGGGAAGLLYSTLLRRGSDKHDVTVLEQNPPDATYGFGVVLTDIALRFLDEVDPKLHQAIVGKAAYQDRIVVVHRGVSVPIAGNAFHGISRLDLLKLLRSDAQAAGVRLVDGRRVDDLGSLEGYDLIVGADGINSVVRNLLSDAFQSIAEHRRNMWAWYGTPRRSEDVHLLFQQTDVGLFIGHTYRYGEYGNTFVVECAPEVWKRAGLDRMSEADSLDYCGKVFRNFLGDKPLISNRSLWFNPAFVRTRNWSVGNVVLIGDALKTVHPTIGSGTRVAMQDAIALAGACIDGEGDVARSLDLFERRRRPDAEGFQDAALRSIEWYETIDQRLALTPLEFAYSFMTRTGKVDDARIGRMDSTFLRQVHAERDAKRLTHPETGAMLAGR